MLLPLPTKGDVVNPRREGRHIILDDDGYDYYCDLREHDVEWWIAHVSEKNWWAPGWAPSMRRLAAQ